MKQTALKRKTPMPRQRTPLRKASRGRPAIDKAWEACKDIVLERADYKCALCSAPTTDVHHIWARNTAKHLIAYIPNCIALCWRHHLGPEGVHRNLLIGQAKIASIIGQDSWDDLYRMAFQTGKEKQ